MEKAQAKVVDLVARLVERGETERAELMADLARRQEAGEDVAVTPAGGIDWRAFAVDFSQRYPGLTTLAPWALGCYIYLFIDFIFGG